MVRLLWASMMQSGGEQHTVSTRQALALAIQHHDAGRLPQAEAIYRQILQIEPSNPGVLNLLGVLAYQLGKHDVAIDLITRAVTLVPDFAEAYRNLGNALVLAGRFDQAIAAHRHAISLRPDLPYVYDNLGAALNAARRWEEGVTACRRAVEQQPDGHVAWYNLGSALYETNQFEKADEAFRQAVRLRPAFGKAFKGLGNALREMGRLEEAIEAYQKALDVEPGLIEAEINLADSHREQGRLDLAIQGFHRAIALQANSARAHFGLATVLLLQGDFAQGWKEFEWRWNLMDASGPAEASAQAPWDGSDLQGQVILIHAEQGFGDVIQFARYIPMVAARGGKIIFACPEEMANLFRGLKGVFKVIAGPDSTIRFDQQCALLSLPRVFKTTLQTIPSSVPYLQADPKKASHWRRKISLPGTLKVGLVWAGRPSHQRNRNRSIKLSSLEPLGKVPGVEFFSLQKGKAAQEAEMPPPGMKLTDWTNELTDFGDTAALIASLDLVITVDTAVAHLAGAMGKPVWLLLPFVPDWRWLLDRTDSPWYPTMRLFRKASSEDWAHLIDRVATELIGIAK